ncbi:hypothetical protein JQR84_24315 (plasmid) [Pseudomonas luteola]|uniref:hypothetical protein n=1 Tax=Pseudomonas TaxID=286 RepID=UPI003DA09E22
MSTFRYICIGLGTLVVFIAALWGGFHGLYGLGYLITATASHFGINAAQLIMSFFGGASEPGPVFVAVTSIMAVVLLSAILVFFLRLLAALGKSVSEHFYGPRSG